MDTLKTVIDLWKRSGVEPMIADGVTLPEPDDINRYLDRLTPENRKAIMTDLHGMLEGIQAYREAQAANLEETRSQMAETNRMQGACTSYTEQNRK